MSVKLHTLNDPIYGFISIPGQLIFDLVEHPFFQRLRRISQMGLSHLVYPGAHHSRFHHALGCVFLMQKSVQALRIKGVEISETEEEALYIAILLHDIGHGPFSHAMEHSIVEGIAHEEISLLFMQQLNTNFNGRLTTAIEIFKGLYPRKFLCQLVSGQLDMDRLDYLKRDSFYAGTPEGNINAERLIAMLNVVNDQLVVEEKGLYSVEKFIIARRFMYWQVYLHKTGLVAEQLLVKILQRAKELVTNGASLPTNATLAYFLQQQITAQNFTKKTLHVFAKLDDYDIMAAIKEWTAHPDVVLRSLCKRLLNRDLFKIKIKDHPFSEKAISKKETKVLEKYNIPQELLHYFVIKGTISNQAYNEEKERILLLSKKGQLIDLAKMSDALHNKAITNSVKKYYLCYPEVKD